MGIAPLEGLLNMGQAASWVRVKIMASLVPPVHVWPVIVISNFMQTAELQATGFARSLLLVLIAVLFLSLNRVYLGSLVFDELL
jgi:hypothetical protein